MLSRHVHSRRDVAPNGQRRRGVWRQRRRPGIMLDALAHVVVRLHEHLVRHWGIGGDALEREYGEQRRKYRPTSASIASLLGPVLANVPLQRPVS